MVATPRPSDVFSARPIGQEDKRNGWKSTPFSVRTIALEIVIAEPASVETIATAGYYIALRVGFVVPMKEINCLPTRWVEHYTRERYMMHDPVIRWVYGNVGMIRWSMLADESRSVLAEARRYGLAYGVAISVVGLDNPSERSFGSFARPDREFLDSEIAALERYLTGLHRDMSPPTNLTPAEIEALRLVKSGLRMKQIAHELGVTEGAVKQRLKNAKLKLGASTGAQAATKAESFNLI